METSQRLQLTLATSVNISTVLLSEEDSVVSSRKLRRANNLREEPTGHILWKVCQAFETIAEKGVEFCLDKDT